MIQDTGLLEGSDRLKLSPKPSQSHYTVRVLNSTFQNLGEKVQAHRPSTYQTGKTEHLWKKIDLYPLASADCDPDSCLVSG